MCGQAAVRLSGTGRAAQAGPVPAAGVVVAARTTEVTDKRLPGTICTVADHVKQHGGRALPVRLDVRDPESIPGRSGAVPAASLREGAGELSSGAVAGGSAVVSGLTFSTVFDCSANSSLSGSGASFTLAGASLASLLIGTLSSFASRAARSA